MDPHTIMVSLDGMAAELDGLSKRLAAVEREREPLQAWHDLVLEAVAVDLWRQYTDGATKRLPGEDVRVALAHERMRQDADGTVRLTTLGTLSAERRRLQARADDLRGAISARQSILAMLKLEVQATR